MRFYEKADNKNFFKRASFPRPVSIRASDSSNYNIKPDPILLPISHLHINPPAQKPRNQSPPHIGCSTALKTAGPGQTPLAPQATPKAAAPNTNLLSTSLIVLVGSENLSSKFGVFRKPLHCMCAILGRIPKSMRSIRLGSHFVISSGKRENAKKALILAGEAMPDVKRPRPNSNPVRRYVVRLAALLEV
jgi:hypothetical protein